MASHFSIEDSLYVNASSGKVGVGITNPSKTFEVVGDIDSTTDYNINGTQVLSATTLGSAVVNSSLTSNTGNLTNTGTLTVSSTGSSPLSVLNASMNDGTSQWVHFGKALSNNDSAALGFEYSSGSSAQLRLGFYGNASDLLVVQEDGKIGMGVDSPSSELHVQKDQNALTQIECENRGEGTAASCVMKCQAASGAMYMQAFDDEFTTSGANIADSGLLSTGSGNSGGLGIRAYSTDGDIHFWTGGNNERMRIDSDGNVGIGTNSPDCLLHLSAGTSGDCVLFIQSDTDNTSGQEGDNPRILFAQDGQTISNADGAIGKGYSEDNDLFLSNGDGDIVFYTNGGDWSNGTERMRINRTSGNIGIGTNSPQELLHISSSGTDATCPTLRIQNTLSGGSGTHVDSEYGSIDFWTSDGNFAIGRIVCYQDGGGTAPDCGLKFYVNENSTQREVMYMHYNGNVGIGTNDPTSLLHVAGTFEATGNNGFTGMVCAFPGELSDTNPSNLYFSFGNGSHVGYGITMVKAGKVIGMSMSSNTDGTTSIELYKNGSATGVTMNFGTYDPPGNEMVKVASATFGHNFAANDALAIKIASTQAGTITAPQCCFWVKYT